MEHRRVEAAVKRGMSHLAGRFSTTGMKTVDALIVAASACPRAGSCLYYKGNEAPYRTCLRNAGRDAYRCVGDKQTWEV